MHTLTGFCFRMLVIVAIAMGLVTMTGSSASAEDFNAECHVEIFNIFGERNIFDEGECVVNYNRDSNSCTITLIGSGVSYSLYPEACETVANGDNYELVLESAIIRIVLIEPLPEDITACKDGGFEGYGFTNQGQCIQFVNTGK